MPEFDFRIETDGVTDYRVSYAVQCMNDRHVAGEMVPFANLAYAREYFDNCVNRAIRSVDGYAVYLYVCVDAYDGDTCVDSTVASLLDRYVKY